MTRIRGFRSVWLALVLATLGTAVGALTGIQVGSSGKTYASATVQCALNPVTGMAPMVQAGLYNPKKSDEATVSLNSTPVATVTFISPDTDVWLSNGSDTVAVALKNKKSPDTYTFDASPTDPNQPNMCIPGTGGNTFSADGTLEYAASGKSYVTVTPGCAWHGSQAQPFVNLVDNGTYLLNVSVNNVAVTQLDGNTRSHTPVLLSAGLNVISAANAALSTDYYVRDGGTGSCTLP